MNQKEAWALPYGVVHFLREHQGSADREIHKKLLQFKSHFKKLPKCKKPLYRGIDLSHKDFLKLLKGEKLKPIKMLESWTTEEEVACGFGSYVFKKTIPAKEQVVDICQLNKHLGKNYDSYYDDYHHEAEVVCYGQTLSLEDLVLSESGQGGGNGSLEDFISGLVVEYNCKAVEKVKVNGTTLTMKAEFNHRDDWSKKVEVDLTIVKGKISNLPALKKTLQEKLEKKAVVAPVKEADVVKYLKKLTPAKRKALLKKVV